MKAKDFLEVVKDFTYGTAGEIRKLEKKLGIAPADLDSIPDLYDYLAELKAKASAAGISHKIGAKEDLWHAGQPGVGTSAQVQSMPEQQRYIATKQNMMKGYWKVMDTKTGETVQSGIQTKSVAQGIADKWNSGEYRHISGFSK